MQKEKRIGFRHALFARLFLGGADRWQMMKNVIRDVIRGVVEPRLFSEIVLWHAKGSEFSPLVEEILHANWQKSAEHILRVIDSMKSPSKEVVEVEVLALQARAARWASQKWHAQEREWLEQHPRLGRDAFLASASISNAAREYAEKMRDLLRESSDKPPEWMLGLHASILAGFVRFGAPEEEKSSSWQKALIALKDMEERGDVPGSVRRTFIKTYSKLSEYDRTGVRHTPEWITTSERDYDDEEAPSLGLALAVDPFWGTGNVAKALMYWGVPASAEER